MDPQDPHRGRKPSLGPDEDFEDELQLTYERWLLNEPGGAALPAEIVEWELAEHLHWTWADVDATPILIRRRWALFMFAKRKAAASRQPPTAAQREHDRAVANRNIAEAAAQVAALEEATGDT